MFHRSTIQLLRFHFSIFLLPVFLFALSQQPAINWVDATMVFFILHVLVYPSSNGYNSYMDRDTGPIGGISKPLQPTRQLFYATIILDICAVAISFFISPWFVAGVAAYIAASRAYSYRGIRLKQYPLTGYLVVVLFQGALVFFLSWHGAGTGKSLDIPLLPMFASALLIGGYYPLTQIFQHTADRNDGVRTLSLLLGIRGTFVYCGIVFALATLLVFVTFEQQGRPGFFYLFAGCMLPMILFFLGWMKKVWKNESFANYRNSYLMNLLAALCTTTCFLIIIYKNLE